MSDTKPISTHLASHFHLSKYQSPKTEKEREFMAKVIYTSAIGSLMYVRNGLYETRHWLCSGSC